MHIKSWANPTLQFTAHPPEALEYKSKNLRTRQRIQSPIESHRTEISCFLYLSYNPPDRSLGAANCCFTLDLSFLYLKHFYFQRCVLIERPFVKPRRSLGPKFVAKNVLFKNIYSAPHFNNNNNNSNPHTSPCNSPQRGQFFASRIMI